MLSKLDKGTRVWEEPNGQSKPHAFACCGRRLSKNTMFEELNGPDATAIISQRHNLRLDEDWVWFLGDSVEPKIMDSAGSRSRNDVVPPLTMIGC